MSQMLQQSLTSFSTLGFRLSLIDSLNSVKQLIFRMVKCCVFFAVQTGFLNIISTKFGLRGLGLRFSRWWWWWLWSWIVAQCRLADDTNVSERNILSPSPSFNMETVGFSEACTSVCKSTRRQNSKGHYQYKKLLTTLFNGRYNVPQMVRNMSINFE